MKKKFLCASLALTMVATTMTACGGDKKPANESTETVSTESTETATEESTNEPTESATEETEPTETECELEGTTIASDEKIDAIVTAVKAELGDNYYPNTPIDATVLQDLYGITLDDVEACFGGMPMISANVDTFIAVKAKEGKAEVIKDELENYLTAQQGDAHQYPANLPKVSEAKVYVLGDYVFYICLAGDTLAAEEKGEAEVRKQVAETVANVITVIDTQLK